MEASKVVRTILSILLVALFITPILQSCGGEPIGGLPPWHNSPYRYGHTREDIQERMSSDHTFLFPKELSFENRSYLFYMLRERKQYSNKEPDGYYSMFSGAIDYDLLYEKEEHFRDAMNRLYGELSGYDPLEVFPAGEYAYPQYSLCVTAQAVLTSEEEEIEYLSSASFLYSYCAILSNIQSAPDVGYYSEDYGVELKSFWGYDTESGLIYKQKDDHTSRAYTASLWLKTIFVYKDVAYCIYLPRIYTRVFYGDPLDTEKMSSQELHGGACRLGVKNSRLAVPYIPAVSRALFDIFFASEIEALNEAAEA